MLLPNYIYPKFYNYSLVKNNDQELTSSILKISTGFKKTQQLKKEEQLNNLNIVINDEYWESKQKILKEKNLEENLPVFSFLEFFKHLRYPIKKFNINNYTNGFRKIYEVCFRTNFINKNLENIRHFDICGFPGGFVLGINYFLKTQTKIKNYQWYIQSYLKSEKRGDSYFKDEFGLRKKYPENFLSKTNNSDITNIENIKYYYQFFKNNLLDIVTSDCGLGIKECRDKQIQFKKYCRELQMAETFFSQFICGIFVLRKGGNFFMKTYHSFSPFMISLIYLMGIFFKNVNLIKPESSRQPSGKEIYILCTNLKKEIPDDIREKLLNIKENFKESYLNKSLIDIKELDTNIINKIQKKLSDYYEDKRNIREKVTNFKSDLIEYDLLINPEEYLSEEKKIITETRFLMLDYVNNYFKRMKYRKISNKDKLI